jgi:VirE N-terminal domain
MFSYFEKGIKDTSPLKLIDLPGLVRVIKNNPHQVQIESIRELKKRGDNYYRRSKETLPNITPNCMVRERSLKDDEFEVNFIGPSGYIYIDIDDLPNAEEYKQVLIKKYGKLAALICISPGGMGITMLFKVTNTITKDNFEQVRATLIKTVLKDEKVCPNSAGIGRAMFISYDPDVFVNYENEITIEECNTEKLENYPNSYSSYNRVHYHLSDKNRNSDTGTINDNNSSFHRYNIYPIDVILSSINTKTNVLVFNPIVDFKAVEFVEPYIHRMITDGNKHRTYYKFIHQWYYVNPNIGLDYLFSYLFFVNNTRAKPRMEMRELVRFFNSVIDKIRTTGEVFPDPFIKRVHFNPAAEISSKEKQFIAAQLNGAYARSITINKIIVAKQELRLQGKKITNRAVARIIRMDEKTVGKYINAAPIDMEYEVSLWN